MDALSGGMRGEQTPEDAPLVIIVDDDQRMRDAIRELLLTVGLSSLTFGSTAELLSNGLPDRPGCLILDVRMPGISGLDLQSQLVANGYTKPILFLTAFADVPMTVQAMKAGAVDFLTKPFRDQDLLDAVARAVELDIQRRKLSGDHKEYFARYQTLTQREREVFQRVVKGKINKQIAFELKISVVTVKLHRGNLTRKMNASSINELIKIWESLPINIREN